MSKANFVAMANPRDLALPLRSSAHLLTRPGPMQRLKLEGPEPQTAGCHRRHILEGTSFRLVKHPLLTVSESGTLS